MKKAFWILILLAVVFAGDRLFGWYLQKQVAGSQFRYSKLYRNEADADIMIVGNSRGLNIYLPEVEEKTSRKAFSLCYNGMPGDLASTLSLDYIDRYPQVKTVIIELCMAEMPAESLLPGFVTYMPYSSRLDSLIQHESRVTWYSSKLSHLYRFNNEVFQRALFYKNRSDDDWTSDRLISERVIKQVGNYSMEFKGDDKQLQYIKSITDYCQQRNIDVKLIIAPFFPGFTVKHIDKLITKTESLTGLKVHDYSKALQDNTGFSDYLHLNVAGCKEFIRLLQRDSLLTVKERPSVASTPSY